MTDKQPATTLAAQFSSEGATAIEWEEARPLLEKAEVYWLSTVRQDGRPHVTPLIAVWQNGALYFATGPTERKAKNLLHNTRCVITTGCNSMKEGLDLVVEGDAVKVSDESKLHLLAQSYASKYGWNFTVRDGAFFGEGGEALVYEVTPSTVFGFAKGNVSSQTRWRF